MSGELGEAAVAETLWNAVTVWLMNMPRSDPALSNPCALAFKAAFLVSRHDRARLGLPHHSGAAVVSPMDDLPEFAWEGIMTAATETMADWERAGRPHLTLDGIRTTRLYLHACARNAAERRNVADAFKSAQEGTTEPGGGKSRSPGALGSDRFSAVL